MDESFTSLVFFTVLSQTAAGGLLFRELSVMRGGFEFISDRFRKRSLLIITLLLILALAIAFFHLGYPVNALNALNNIGKSWLSREILSLSLLIAALLIYLIIIFINKSERAAKALSLVTMILSISFIFSMIKLYLIPSVTSWYHPFTPVSFIITILLCGNLLLSVIIGKNIERFNSIAAPLNVILIISSLANSILFPGTFSEQRLYLFIIRTALSIISLFIIVVAYFRTPSNKTCIRWVILFLLVLSSEIINRYIFFLSFEKTGL